MNNMRIFISGGAGVIGREMIPKLVARGATVMVGDLKCRPSDFPPEVIYRQGDLNYMKERELRQFEPDVFIHLAATFERSTESYEFWEDNFWHNVRLSHHLMTLAKEQPTLRRVVFASSYLIYEPSLYQFDTAQTKAVSLRESDPVQPRNLTGMAKFAHEIELRFIDQFRQQQFSTVCARIYRGYGRNSRDVISRWIRSLLEGKPITVYRPEGLFDYIYAADTAEGLIRLAETPDIHGIINLGTGRARRVQEVLDVLGRHFPGMQTMHAEADIPFEASEANMDCFRGHFGWVPEYDLERAIPEMIAFERTRHADLAAVPVPLKVLVSSASRKVPLVRGMKTAARRVDLSASVVAGDLCEDALTAYVADEFWAMPPTCDEMLDSIIDGCRARGINIVLPTRDGELEFWSRHASRLADAGIVVITSPVDSLKRCIDKLAFSNFGAVKQLPLIPASTDIDDIQADSYVVKERFGAGSRAIGLGLDRAQALAHATGLEEPIFQPFMTGLEFSVDAWVDSDFKVKGLVLRRRDMVVNGESQVTTTFSDDALEAGALIVIEALQLRGPVVLQAIVDESGSMHVIECNARFGGASTTGIAAGVDSLFWSLLEARGINVGTYPFLPASEQIRQVRVPADIYINDPDI